MKLFLLPLLLTISLYVKAQQVTPKSAFLEKWENSRVYLIEIAAAMPDSLYDYKPTERQMTFKEQLLHIQDNMNWLGTTYFSKDKPQITTIPTSKAEVLNMISDAFQRVSEQIKYTSEEQFSETVKFFAGPKSRLQLLNLLQDHVTHHRGQLIVYLNLNDINPPNYLGW